MPRKLAIKSPRAKSHHAVCPPNSPWIKLMPKPSRRAALSFYYSDTLSKVPIRDISNRSDPKADPNLETKTFGLFSRCDRGMRATIVRQGIELHFFCTNRAGIRVLTGYYRYGWYFKAQPVKKKTGNAMLEDYMLAAKEIRFVSPGFRLCDLTGYLYGFRLDRPFRTFRYIAEKNAARLLLLLNETPNATGQYLSEIRRVEQLVKQRDKFVYRNRPNGFSWDSAAEAMRLNHRRK